jgi:hypothetical protein
VKQGENPVETESTPLMNNQPDVPTAVPKESDTLATTTIPNLTTTTRLMTTTTVGRMNAENILTKFGKLQLPTPKEGTTFLVNTPGEIVIAAIAVCPDNCEMRVSFNGAEYYRRSFRMNEQPIARIPGSSIQYGDYTWTFTTGDKDFKHSFKIKKYSNENLMEAMKSKAPVEIMN